jgi:hypothetical protein
MRRIWEGLEGWEGERCEGERCKGERWEGERWEGERWEGERWEDERMREGSLTLVECRTIAGSRGNARKWTRTFIRCAGTRVRRTSLLLHSF